MDVNLEDVCCRLVFDVVVGCLSCGGSVFHVEPLSLVVC
jgi:hypothetical protein